MFKLHFTHLALFFNILYEISPSTYLIVIHQVLIRPIHTYLKIESILTSKALENMIHQFSTLTME